jgi:DNA transformation protein
MAPNSPRATPSVAFAQHCGELLASLGEVKARRMFLGWGLSVDGLTVAVIAWDTLFLKADDTSEPLFVAAGCRVFEHTAKGVTRRMRYYTAPEEALESPAAMQPWARRALQAALSAHRPAKRRPRSETPAERRPRSETPPKRRPRSETPASRRPARKKPAA